MAHYIDKDALVAEIERRMQELHPTNTHQMQVGEKMDRDVLMWLNALTWVKDFLDSLEVKEADINEEAKRKWDSFSLCYDELRGCDVVVWPYWVYKQVCKYFFELGLKAQKGE